MGFNGVTTSVTLSSGRRGVFNGIGLSGGEGPGFALLSVTPQGDKVVRVAVERSVLHADEDDPHDALNPSNYLFTGGLVAESVVRIADDEYDVTLTTEMRDGMSYVLKIINIQDEAGHEPDPELDADTASFIGSATAPELSSVLPGERRLDVSFSEPMDVTTLQLNAFSLAPNGGSGVAVLLDYVENVSDQQVRLHLKSRMSSGQPYRLTLNATAKDKAGNPSAGGHIDFTGHATPLTFTLSVLSKNAIQVMFNSDVTSDSQLTTAANYQWSNGLKTLGVTIQGLRSVILTTTEMQHGVEYTLTI